jgi:miniconductance mechanosensitive channel
MNESIAQNIDSTGVHFFGEAQRTKFIGWTNDLLSNAGLKDDSLIYSRTAILLVVGVILGAILWWVTRRVLIVVIHRVVSKSKTKWDDHLVKNRFFAALAYLMPFLFLDFAIRTIFYDFKGIADLLIRLTDSVIILIVIYVVLRFLNAIRDALEHSPRLVNKPIASYIQLSKIIITGLLIILMVSIAFRVEPLVILTSMGAITAILLLIFKDTILGFVGSIQLAANDMIRIGDWITMEKFGADGDVVEINLATVKVQNFDKTITTIPTYSFISDSFKNWRGMMDSEGRRIMRSINIKIQSVKFCNPELLSKLAEIELIRDYVTTTEDKIKDFNVRNKVNRSVLLNGLNQTNLGIFRHYIKRYLESSKEINHEMPLMVRQLEPKDTGVPIQLYTFTKTQELADYERVMADIFDHLLAAVQYFELEVFEQPAGSDMRALTEIQRLKP